MVPDKKEVVLLGYTYTSGYFESVKYTVWTLMGKVIPISFLFLWSLTNKKWWFWVLYVPICVYIYQIIYIIQDDIMVFDDYTFWVSLPFSIPIIFGLYFVRKKLRIYADIYDLTESLKSKFSEDEKH